MKPAFFFLIKKKSTIHPSSKEKKPDFCSTNFPNKKKRGQIWRL
jgi:hypothetical protein